MAGWHQLDSYVASAERGHVARPEPRPVEDASSARRSEAKPHWVAGADLALPRVSVSHPNLPRGARIAPFRVVLTTRAEDWATSALAQMTPRCQHWLGNWVLTGTPLGCGRGGSQGPYQRPARL